MGTAATEKKHIDSMMSVDAKDSNKVAKADAMDPDITRHPEYADFIAGCTVGLGVSVGKANAIWTLMMNDIQGIMGAMDTADATGGDSRQAKKDYVSQEKAFAKLADELEPHLKVVEQGQQLLADGTLASGSLGLWSGGYDLSMYGRSKGHTMLEATNAGGLFDQFSFIEVWAPKGPFWNAISRRFVEADMARDEPIHIFARSLFPDSVLMSQEIVQFREENVKRSTPKEECWHMVFGSWPIDLLEVDTGAKLVDDKFFASDGDAAGALRELIDFKLNELSEKSREATEAFHVEYLGFMAGDKSPMKVASLNAATAESKNKREAKTNMKDAADRKSSEHGTASALYTEARKAYTDWSALLTTYNDAPPAFEAAKARFLELDKARSLYMANIGLTEYETP